MSVRRATPADRDAVIATVVAAFAAYEAWHYILDGADDFRAGLFAGALFDTRVTRGGVWVAEDCAAVAMWDAPADGDASAAQARAAVWERYREAVGESAWARLQAYDTGCEAVMPPQPYWYLGVLGTRPGSQGRGLARAVLAPVLAIADRDGLDAYLETSDPANLPKYAALGFTAAADIVVPGGPQTWWLRRPPTRPER